MLLLHRFLCVFVKFFLLRCLLDVCYYIASFTTKGGVPTGLTVKWCGASSSFFILSVGILSTSVGSVARVAELMDGEGFGTPDPLPDRQFDRPGRATSVTFIDESTAGMGVGNATVRVVVGSGVYTAIVRSIAMKRDFSTERTCGTFTTGGPAVGPGVRTDYQVGPFVGPIAAPTPAVAGVVVSVVCGRSCEIMRLWDCEIVKARWWWIVGGGGIME